MVNDEHPNDANQGFALANQGFALAMSLMVLLILSMILGVLAIAVQIQDRELIRESRRLRADALADAVLAETLAGLARTPNYAGVAGHEMAGGFVASTVRRRGRLATVELEVEVELGPTHRRIEARVELIERRPRVLGWRSASSSGESSALPAER